MTNRINISEPAINVTESLANIVEALSTGQIAQGIQVKMAEKAIGELLSGEHTALLSNGTSSLRAALVASVSYAHGVDRQYVDRFIRDREVIIPAYSFNATINTVLQTGARAIVVDIDETDFGIDPEKARNAMTDNTVAIMPVDLYGQAANVSSRDTDFSALSVVRDAAQAHGATIHGEPLTAHADAVSLSFYPTKNIAAPEGGAVMTEIKAIDETVRIYRNQGMIERYQYEMVGDNLRMTDIHAAILRANLGQFAAHAARRQANAALYSEALADIPGVITPTRKRGHGHAWHQYTIRVTDGYGVSRERLASRLQEERIATGIYYPKTMTDHHTFEDHPQVISTPTPVANAVAKEVLSLPVHPGLSDEDVLRVSDEIKKNQRNR